MDFMYQRQIKEAASEFPETFGLRSYPGEVYRISLDSSYWGGNSEKEEVILYLQRLTSDGWRDFVKGTAGELRLEIVPR